MSGVLLATAGYDHTIRLWEAPSGICYKTMQHPDSQVNKLEISPDKQYIAAALILHDRLCFLKSKFFGIQIWIHTALLMNH